MSIDKTMKSDITIYTVEQVAKLFNVPKFTIREWAKDGQIPCRKVGKRWFFEEKAILEHLNTINKKNE